MNSLVDTYKDRYWDPRRGQVIGVNYGPSGQAIESELGLGSGKRIAGDALGLDVSALMKLVFRPGIDEFEIERGPYNRDKDPFVIEKLPYFPGGDDGGIELMLASAEHPKFRAGAYSQLGARPKGLRAIGPDALNSLPNSEIAKDKYMRIRNAIDLPKF